MTLPNLTLKRGGGSNLKVSWSLDWNAPLADELKDGVVLPSERQLAAQLGLSRTIVVSSYRESELGGLVRSHVGRGAFGVQVRKQTMLPLLGAARWNLTIDFLALHTGITCTRSEDRALLTGRFERHWNVHVLFLRFMFGDTGA